MTCELYLISPPAIDDLPGFAKTLDATLLAAPVAAFQLRLKRDGQVAESSVVVQAAKTIFPIVRRHGALAFLNDDPRLAAELGADGVHIGQGDGSVAEARDALGGSSSDGGVVGVTCHTSKDLAFRASADGADYVAFGAFYPTATKEPPETFRGEDGLELLSWWQTAMTVPCLAIGGITPANAGPVVEAGADFLAVSGGVWDWPDGPEAALRSLWDCCRG